MLSNYVHRSWMAMSAVQAYMCIPPFLYLMARKQLVYNPPMGPS